MRRLRHARRLVTLVVACIVCAPASRAQNASPSGPINPAFVVPTVEALGAVVKREYFDPDVAHRVDATLRQWLLEGRYATATTAEMLATLLSRDLYAITRDKHLSVAVVRDPPAEPERATAHEDEIRAAGARRTNYGVRRIEILPGNVGYLDLSFFYRPEEARDALATAMHVLGHADALILDMRRNSGGSPGTIALLLSYLFDAPGLPLFDIVHRPPEPVDQYTTEATPLPDRDSRRPVYVLTAADTFSGGEGLAFLLQERHRAEVVGETTAGAANPGRSYPVNARFSVTVPNGRLRSAIGGRNWEGVGVTPDVRMTAAEALNGAYARALRTLMDREPAGAWRETLDRILGNVQGRSPGR
jgi:hypothetical protein